MSKILGIDLGTTNSAMAAMKAGEPSILENDEGNRTTPSVVALNKSGERLVGQLAKRQAVVNPAGTIYAVKRLIGRKFSEAEVQEDKKSLSYEIKESDHGGVDIQMGEKWYKPEEISAMVLQKLKADAEARLGEKIDGAVITVPAYFDDSQRQATKQAGEIAGFSVKRILNEPTAAALAYGLNKKTDEKIVVYDFGGGTFDVSILEVGDNTVEVRATGGDPHLGGEDFDNKILNYLLEEYKKQEGVDLSKDKLAIQRLKEAAERAKHELSSAQETEVNLPYITSDENGPKHFTLKLTRAKLESLVEEFIDRSVKLVEKAVTDSAPQGAGLQLSDIDEIVLVGGQTRMPAIQEAVKKLFGKDPHKGINPDEVVSVGAAIQGEIIAAKEEGRKPEGEVKDILLLDVTPLTLSLETLGGVATPMIEKNTTIPTSKTQVFSTAADNQTSVEIHIGQGERSMMSDNKTLGKFILDGIPPSPRGVPQVEVTFDIDANGILNVSAKDKASGKSQSVRIEATTSLNKEEVEKLKKEAAEHASEDQKKKELIEARNQAESLAYTAEKSLKDAGDKVPADVRTNIEEKIKNVREVRDKDDTAAIQTAMNELSQEIQKIGQSMYNEKKEESAPEEKKEGEDASSETTPEDDSKSEHNDN